VLDVAPAAAMAIDVDKLAPADDCVTLDPLNKICGADADPAMSAIRPNGLGGGVHSCQIF
jgi:hypothetical protein